MNILIPYTWLLDHLDTKATPAQIRTHLSLCGPSVERIHDKDGEPVFDIEVTTNRVDAASVMGIAREASVILPEFDLPAKLKPLPPVELPETAPALDIVIDNDPKLCHRILAVKLTGVKIGPSPKWLQQRLTQVEQRPLNNIIDITNYLMWAIGHPVHAFDYDKLTQKRLLIRAAKAGEKLTTLDGKTHTLKGGEVVIDNGLGTIIDLPGIMGAQNTSVDESTQNVLLFIDDVDPVRIRQASMNLAIRSQAAILNEKQVDPELGLAALYEGVRLSRELTGAQVGSRVVDIYPKPPALPVTTVPQALIDTYLGLRVKPERITRILTRLGCRVKPTAPAAEPGFVITPPSWRRNDLIIPQDYIEEIARIYGYHHLPSVIMATPIPDHPPEEDFRFENRLKNWLTGWGCQEVYTYSMVSKALAQQAGFPVKDHLRIANPLSDEWVFMRRSLLPSLQAVLQENPGPHLIFELQNVYHPKGPDQLPDEELHLTLAASTSFARLKGCVDALALNIFAKNTSIIPHAKPQPGYLQSADILINDTVVGTLGQSQQKPAVFAADYLVARLQKVAADHPAAIKLCQYAPVIEDLTFTVTGPPTVGHLIDAIKAVDPLIDTVTLKDVYHQNHTFTITYRSNQSSLSSQAIAPIRKAIVTALAKKGHQLVGTV